MASDNYDQSLLEIIRLIEIDGGVMKKDHMHLFEDKERAILLEIVNKELERFLRERN